MLIRTFSHSYITLLLSLTLAAPFASATTKQKTEVEKDYYEAQILSLRYEAGAKADAERQNIPVPLNPIDLDSYTARRVVNLTEAGVPRVVDPAQQEETHDRRMERRSIAGGADTPELMDEQGPERHDEQDQFHTRTIFGADNRSIFHDHGYPWLAVGRVSNSGGSCSGTLVGPQHMLTASHCVQWNGDGTVGWLKFEASRFDYHDQGVAWATRLYYHRKVVGPQLDGTDIAFDFVVAILDRRMGSSLGWMGTRTYTSSWNGGNYWANVGYPGDLGSSIQPVYQNGCAITGTTDQCTGGLCSTILFSLCDIFPGQSGSALFGNWSDGPYVIAVTSAENSQSNFFGGGSLLTTLVNQARTQYP